MKRRFTRGEIGMADIGYGPHPYVVISSDLRNRALDSVLAARVTSRSKRPLTSIVELGPAEHPLHGRVLCDNIIELDHDELTFKGRLSGATMRRVDEGLLVALGLDLAYTRR